MAFDTGPIATENLFSCQTRVACLPTAWPHRNDRRHSASAAAAVQGGATGPHPASLPSGVCLVTCGGSPSRVLLGGGAQRRLAGACPRLGRGLRHSVSTVHGVVKLSSRTDSPGARGGHQGQTSREGERDIWCTAGTKRGGAGNVGLTHTETQRGRLWTACGQRQVGSKNSQTTLATTSTTSIRQLLGATDAQTAHHATSSTAPTHQRRGSANTQMTPAGAPAAAADRTQRPDATCEGKNG